VLQLVLRVTFQEERSIVRQFPRAVFQQKVGTYRSYEEYGRGDVEAIHRMT
jgi:hypothetical protein